ncbi:hypothetical protein [Lysobacter gummosus]|uniref:hypothetical protein n=1 Tax=Lysobacter gummosus TaxID=262324 RepID=UPI003645BC61
MDSQRGEVLEGWAEKQIPLAPFSKGEAIGGLRGIVTSARMRSPFEKGARGICF